MRPPGHDHSHGTIDPVILTTQHGIAAIKWSAVALLITALIQFAIVLISGSVALLADTIHNLGDAASVLPLWLAFVLARRQSTLRFTYGYGRAEDFAGILIVFIILTSGIVVAYASIVHLWHPPAVQYLGAVAAGSVIGFLGNEAVARYRLKVGQEIGSAALIADGHHARTDGLSSLSVLGATLGVWLGVPIGRSPGRVTDCRGDPEDWMGIRLLDRDAHAGWSIPRSLKKSFMRFIMFQVCRT